MKTALTFDDLLLIPQYSDLGSRSEVDISTSLSFPDVDLKIPLISAAMDSVTEIEMQVAMMNLGGLGIHHRYGLDHEYMIVASYYGPIAVSPSMGTDFLEILFDKNPEAIIKIDVAHGDNANALYYAEGAARLGLSVISGNVVTPEGAMRYWNSGVRIISVGIGGGSACSTRVVAGIGYPQLSAIMEVNKLRCQLRPEISIISDGGIKSSGDIVKALAAGADAVIIGSLFAGTYEAPGEFWSDMYGKTWKSYRGMASAEALKEAGKEVNPEGVSGKVPWRGYLRNVVGELVNGVRAGFAYLGAQNIQELRENARWIRVTQNGTNEGEPRI